MILIACAADCKKGMYPDLRRQVEKAGMDFLFHELNPFSWSGMIQWEREVAYDHPSDIVCFVDAWDFLLQGTAQDIVAALGNNSLLFHSEAACWPEPHKADLYPTAPTRYRYVNGTGPCGYGSDIVEAIDYGRAHFPIRGRESSMFADCDQRFWTDVFLSGRGAIDYDCKLSVSLNAVQPDEFTVSERRLKLNSGVTPAFIHFNGASKNTYSGLVEMLK